MNINDIPKTGLVYRLIIGDYHYTGSTCDTIHNRYNKHIQAYKTSKDNTTRKLYEYIRSLEDEWNSVKISILEKDIPIDKLLQREQSYINKEDKYCLNCYNSIAPLIKINKKNNRTDKKINYDKEYYNSNKEKLKEARRKRYEEDKQNPERYAIILEKGRQAQARYNQKRKGGIDV